MKLLTTVSELQEFRNSLKDKTVGFVPTMGALHDGHGSLIKRARAENDIVIVSIFVNPTQFLEGEDLDKYPRQLESDREGCVKLGVDAVFVPNVNDMYGENEPKIVADLIKGFILEGKNRPGHFDGMLTIVLKLLNTVKPTKAYFGKKDAQQLLLIEKMVESFFLDVEVVPCELIREKDGLAMSSRNAYLSNEDRENALLIYKGLNYAKMLIVENNEKDVSNLKKEIEKFLEPLSIEYIEVTDRKLNKIDFIEVDNSIILLAVKVGTTRLIDNIWI